MRKFRIRPAMNGRCNKIFIVEEGFWHGDGSFDDTMGLYDWKKPEVFFSEELAKGYIDGILKLDKTIADFEAVNRPYIYPEEKC